MESKKIFIFQKSVNFAKGSQTSQLLPAISHTLYPSFKIMKRIKCRQSIDRIKVLIQGINIQLSKFILQIMVQIMGRKIISTRALPVLPAHLGKRNCCHRRFQMDILQVAQKIMMTSLEVMVLESGIRKEKDSEVFCYLDHDRRIIYTLSGNGKSPSHA